MAPPQPPTSKAPKAPKSPRSPKAQTQPTGAVRVECSTDPGGFKVTPVPPPTPHE